MAQIRIIKKYPNRRLYDTEISSYITLEDVRQLIVDNEAFEVRDAKTGDDLTRAVLLQIISEHEDDGQPMLSTELLSQIIRFYGDSLQGFMGSYLERSMQMFIERLSSESMADWISIFVLSALLAFKKVHPILIIVLAAALGIAAGALEQALG